MPVYKVKEPIKHDGKHYGEDDTVEMSAAAAKPLLAAGVLAPKTGSKPKGKPEGDK